MTLLLIPPNMQGLPDWRNATAYETSGELVAHFERGDTVIEIDDDLCLSEITMDIETMVEEREGWGIENARHIKIESALIRQPTGVTA